MSAEIGANPEQAPQPERTETAVAKRKKVPHLAPVENIPAQGLDRPRLLKGRMPTIAELERYATVLRIDCVRMLAVAKSGHLDSSLSAADIVAALYYRVLRHDPERPNWPGRDRFVLCKGHAAPIQYAALARHGYFPLPGPDGAAKARRPSPGPSGHDPHARASRSRPARSGRASRCRLGIALGLRLDKIDEAHVFGDPLRRRLPGGPDLGGARWRRPTPRSRT